MSDDCELTDLDDAIIEDTVHCCVCGCSFLCGGNDGVFIDAAKVKLRPGCNGAFCIQCAAEIFAEYKKALDEMSVCEHGITDGNWCPECRKEYAEAQKRYEQENP